MRPALRPRSSRPLRAGRRRGSLPAYLLAVLVALAACGPGERPSPDDPSPATGELPPLPEIEAGKVSKEAGEHLARARARIEELRREEASDAELAAAYGLLGETAQAYEFPDLALAAYERARRLDAADGEWDYLRGVILQERGELEAARDAFAARLEEEREDPATHLRLADVYRDLGESERADALFRRVLEDGPEEAAAAAHYGLGRTATAAGRHAEAVEHLSAALELQPEASNLHSLLAAAHRRLGNREAAEHHARRLGAGGVEFPDSLLERTKSRIEGAGVHLERAFLAAQDHRFAEAAAEYERALEYEPENTTALRGLAKSHRDLGRMEESLATYDRLLAVDPRHAVGRTERANVLMEMGREDEAAEVLRAVLADEPEFEEALLNLALAHLRKERWEEAAGALERLLEIEPGSPDGLYRLAQVRRGQGRAEAAVELLRRLLRETPTHVPGHRLLGRLLEERDDLAGALESYRAVLALEGLPEREEALTRYEAGRILALLGRHAEAGEEFRRSLDLAPGLQPARFALGNVLVHRGDFAAAAEAFRQVAEADPRNVSARERELDALLHAGRFEEATKRADLYLEEHPRSAQIGHQKARALALGPPGVGDPAAALELADGVFRAHQSLEHAETLVMALAATGRHEEAVARQQDLIRRAEAGGRDDLLPRLRANLERYRRGDRPELSP